MEEGKSCNNCKHYHRYYVRSGVGFCLLNKGHCSHPKRRRGAVPELCGHWEIDEREEQRIYALKKNLEEIVHRLTHIITALP